MCINFTHVDKLIQNYSLSNLPHSNLIVGESGSGKHTLVTRLSERLGLPVYDITDKISQELIEDIYLSSDINVYIINGNNLSIKDQNTILKFIEEPSNNIYIFILIDNISSLLPTIRNRCIRIDIPPYSEEELRVFTDDDLYLALFHTPGLINRAKRFDLGKLVDYQNKIIDSISRANISNVLSIKDKMKLEIPGIENDYDLFFKVLESVLIERIKSGNLSIYLDMYRCVAKYSILSCIPKVTTENIFIRFLLEFKAIADGYKRS